MPLRCLYLDLDGTLLAGGSLLGDGDGGTSLLGMRAIEACHRAGVAVVVCSGRERNSCGQAARLLGCADYIYEAGCGLVIDGEEDTALLGEWSPAARNGDGAVDTRPAGAEAPTPFQLIEDSGAPALLLDRYDGRLEYHSPWHANRSISHLFRGVVDVVEVDELLSEHGLGTLRLVDNGAIHPPDAMPGVVNPRGYHLIPAQASKGFAVARHQQIRGFAPEDCIAAGDSREDLSMAPRVSTFWLVANALAADQQLSALASAAGNVEVAESGYGAGVYEAVMTTLAVSR